MLRTWTSGMNIRWRLGLLATIVATLAFCSTPRFLFAQQEEEKESAGDEKQEEGEGAKTGEKPQKIEIDPELQKRIDEMLERDKARKQELQGQIQANPPQPPQGQPETKPATRVPPRRTSRRPGTPGQPTVPGQQPQEGAIQPTGADAGQPTPTTMPAMQPGVVTPTEERSASTAMNIEPKLEDIPPELRSYRFSIKDGTYEQLVEGFARQTGLGVIGEAPKDGKVSFVSTEELSYEDAIGRVRMLLFKYKPHEPFWLERRETHLEVIRVTDLYRILPPERMFSSIDAMRAAGFRQDELALVVYSPDTGSVADLQMVRDFLPDYVRVAPLPNGTSVSIFALIKDIEKYLWLVDFWGNRSSSDPRALERIEVVNMPPSQALGTLQQLMDVATEAGPRPSVRRPGQQPSPLDVMTEPAMTIIPDDAQGILIVQAMKDKIEKIKKLLAFIDVALPLPNLKPTIVEVKYALPDQLIATIQQILSTSAAPTMDPAAGGASRRRSTPRSPAGTGVAVPGLSAEGVTMFPHPTLAAIVVLADDPTVARVRELVQQFDVKGEGAPMRIPLTYSDAAEAATTVQMVMGARGATRGKPAPDHFQLVPDPSNTSLWFVGTQSDLVTVKEILAMIDTPTDPVSLRIVTLLYQQASFVANLLKELESGVGAGSVGGPAATPSRGRSTPRRARTVVASKFTPDDANNRLYILCTDGEWQDYKALIEKLDIPAAGESGFVRLPVAHISADDVVDQIRELMNTGDPRDAAVRFISTGDAILALGANEPQLQRLRGLIRELDKPVELVERTFEIRHADMAIIKTAIETFIGGDVSGAERRVPRRRGGGPAGGDGKVAMAVGATIGADLTMVEVGQRLVVRTTASKMEEVARLIEQFDIPASPEETRVYSNFPPGTDVSIVADSLIAMMPGTSVTGPGQPGRPQTAAGGPRFIPLPATLRLIVIAKPEEFAQIEKMIDMLKWDGKSEPTTVAFVDVQHVDPQDLVDQIHPLLELKTRELSQTDPQTVPAGAAPQTVPMRRRGSALGSTTGEFHLSADVRNRRIVIAARQSIIDHTRELVAQFDQPYQAEVVFKTVALENSDVPSMVRAITEMLGSRTTRAVRKTPTAQPGVPEPVDGTPLSVVEAPGGSSIILHGTARDVDEAEVWIHHLDAIATTGKVVKVFDIKYADIKTLGNLIMNVVERQESPLTAQQARKPRLPTGMKGLAAEEEEEEFELTKTWVGQDVYMQGDLVGKVMIVAASEGKLTKIEELVAEFDKKDAKTTTTEVPSFTYELTYVDSLKGEFELEAVLDELWVGEQKPQVSSAMFGDYLVVKHPDRERFPKIKEWIREYVDKPDPKDLLRIKRAIPVPTGATPEYLANWLKTNYPEIEFEIEKAPVPKSQDYHNLKVLNVGRQTPPNPCVMPLSLNRAVEAILAGVAAQNEKQPPDDQQPPAEETQPPEQNAQPDPPPVEEEPSPEEPMEEEPAEEPLSPDLREQMIRSQMQPVDSAAETKSGTEDEEKDRKSSRPRAALEGKKVKVTIDKDGNLIAEGEAGVLEHIQDWLDSFKEEIKDLKVPPDIRIVQLRYVDVHYAAEILEEMFNATRQQLATVEAAQRRAQQMAQQQQRQQQQQQRQQQRGEEQQPGDDRAQRGQQQPQQPQIQQVPELPPTSVRVFANPRDRSLILRADTDQYPSIFELLATIDQPQPIEAELKVFTLTKLNAKEVVDMLSKMLGLDGEGGSGASGRAPRARRGGDGASAVSGGASSSLPRTITNPTFDKTIDLNVNPADINVSASEAANAIVVMAPPKALDYIESLIKQLEGGNIPERVPRYFPLVNADPQEVAEFLTEQYEKTGVPGGSAGGKAAAQSLNTPSFIAYPPQNLVTAVATEEQLKKIEETINLLDVRSDQEKWQYHTLTHADAQFAADTLGQMFAGTGGSGGGGTPAAGRRVSAVGSGGGPVFIGEPGARLLVYKAPQALLRPIEEAIVKLEADAATVGEVRTVHLQHATPSKVADAITKAFAPPGTAKGPRGGASRVSVTSDDATGTLFVVADDASYAKIESLLQTLDQPGEISADFRIYPLQFAEARRVHTIMSKMIKEFLTMVGPGRGGMDAFSVEADERTNSLIVLGGPKIFGFVEAQLPKVDNPANLMSPPATLMIALKNARAEEVAASITRLYTPRAQAMGETPPQADANRSLNTLIVRGTQKQIDEIKKEFVDPLESQSVTALKTETITLQYADAESVADAVVQIFEDRRKANQIVAGAGGNANPTELAVAVTPDVTARQIIVQATQANLDFIHTRVAELDKKENAEMAASSVRIYPLQNADTDAVVRIISEWSKARQQMSGRSQRVQAADSVTATSEPMTQSVVVTSSEASHMIIAEMIQNLDKESAGAKAMHRVKLTKADAEELSKALQEVYRGRTSTARRGQQPVQITAEKATNSLLIVANDVEFAEVKTLIDSLDVDPDPTRRQLKTIKLTHADPWTVKDAISELFRPGVGGRDTKNVITAVADSGSRSVVVTASPEDMRRVEELVSQLDTEEGAKLDVHVVNVANADPGALAQTLTEIFIRSAPKQGTQGPSISISALQGSKALLVKAGTEDFEDIKAAVTQLDEEASRPGEEVRIVPLLYAEATEVEAAVKNYLTVPGGGRGQAALAGDMRLAVLAQSNSIVVSGEKAGVERIVGLIGQMDTTGEKGSVPQIIKLQHANVGQILPNLQEMFTEKAGPSRKGQAPPILVANDTLNSLIVRASPTDFAAIESLIQQLDTPEQAAGKAFLLIQMAQGINVTDLGEKVEQTINEGARKRPGRGSKGEPAQVTIIPDTRSGSLIVSGDPSLFDETEGLARALEKMGPQGGMSVKVITLDTTGADDLLQAIALLKGEDRGSSERPSGSRSGSSRPRPRPSTPARRP